MAEACGFPPGLVRGEAVPEPQVPAIFRHRYSALDARKIARELGLSKRCSRHARCWLTLRLLAAASPPPR